MPKPRVPSKAKNVASEAEMLRVSELETLKAVMPPVYKMLAGVYSLGGGELNSYILEHYLPGLAFKIARESRLVSASSYYVTPVAPQEGSRFPKEHFERPDVQMLGNWLVTKAFAAEFFGLLRPAISSARKLAEANAAAGWESPTPLVRVHMFLQDVGWQKARLIEAMADKLEAYAAERKAAKKEKRTEYGDSLQAAKKQLTVITAQPDSPTSLKHYHVLLCDVMREHSAIIRQPSQDYTSLSPLDLLWRHKG
jgi:hypothetical protein